MANHALHDVTKDLITTCWNASVITLRISRERGLPTDGITNNLIKIRALMLRKWLLDPGDTEEPQLLAENKHAPPTGDTNALDG